jgi:dTMP kinase
MATGSLRLSPGNVVVFEGLDRAGKSTQLELLKAKVGTECASFAHMPSGYTAFSQGLYQVLEHEPPSSGLARQLAHLACHHENMPKLVRAARSHALVLDRWWWSTMAYGWYGGDIEKAGISEGAFRGLIERIWSPITASAVFLFLTPYEKDPNNIDGVALGYRRLAAEQAGIAVIVPAMPTNDTHDYIVTQLLRLGIAEAQ